MFLGGMFFSDVHIAVINDVKHILTSMGIRWSDYVVRLVCVV
jgi:hypothetical protein